MNLNSDYVYSKKIYENATKDPEDEPKEKDSYFSSSSDHEDFEKIGED